MRSQPQLGGRRTACSLALLVAAFLPAGKAVADHATELVSTSGPVDTVDEVLALTLERSPIISSLRREIAAREGLVRQAGARPNPELEAILEQFGGNDGPNPTTQSEVSLNQRLERGGKRSARIEAALADRELLELRNETLIWDTVAEARKAFARLQAAYLRQDLLEEQLKISSELVEASGRRVRAGAVLAAEEAKAQIALASDTVELARTEQEIISGQANLAAFWNGTEQDVGVADVTAWTTSAPPAVDLSSSLRFRLIEREVKLGERNLAVEQAKAYQDVTLKAGYQRLEETSDNAVIVGVSVPLGVFDQNRGGIESAFQTVEAARLRGEGEKRSLTAQLRTLNVSLNAVLAEARTLEQSIIPKGESTLGELKRAYALGLSGYLDLLDSSRMLLTSRMRRVETLLSAAELRADIDRLSATAPFHPNKQEQRR